MWSWPKKKQQKKDSINLPTKISNNNSNFVVDSKFTTEAMNLPVWHYADLRGKKFDPDLKKSYC